jgi:hypothetical protein
MIDHIKHAWSVIEEALLSIGDCIFGYDPEERT